MLLVAAFCWGSGNVANKTVLQDLDPFAAVLARSLVAALILLPFAIKEFAEILRPAAWLRSVLGPSVLFAIAVALQQWAYQAATVTNASFLVNTAGVLTPLVAYAVYRERLNPGVGLAAILTLIGAFLMSGASNSLSRMNVGDLACLASALFYAAWMVVLSRHAVSHGKAVATTFCHVVVTFVLAALVLGVTQPVQPGNWSAALPEVLYLGVFSTALAFGLTAAAQAHVSASTAAVLVAAESLFGAAGGILVLGERPDQTAIVGAVVMLAAIVLAACRPTAAVGALCPLTEPARKGSRM
jgi:drug/metabolite transporter (DMT)-like permease